MPVKVIGGMSYGLSSDWKKDALNRERSLLHGSKGDNGEYLTYEKIEKKLNIKRIELNLPVVKIN